MHNRLLPILLLLFISFNVLSQVPANTAANAFTITRMAEKLHIAPRAINDSFSVFVYDKLMESLDEGKYIFTQQDMNLLLPFRYKLDKEVLQKKQTFLSTLTLLYKAALLRSDSILKLQRSIPEDLFKNEKFTVSEFENFPENTKAQKEKLRKVLKSEMLDAFLQLDSLPIDKIALKNYFAKAEPVLRSSITDEMLDDLQQIQQAKGGIPQVVANEYCKAIALFYDPHTEFFPLTEKENFETQVGLTRMVFGFNFKEDDEGLLRINNVQAGGPAFKSGQINKGDRILSIQWADEKPIDVSNAGIEKIKSVLEISNHDKATFKIKKLDGSERVVVLYKEKLESEDDEDGNKVKSFVLKGEKNVGFISLPSFYQDWEETEESAKGCANDVAKEILKLKQQNIQGLIIDLRFNGGGSLQEAIELSGIFIDAGPVAMQKGRADKPYVLKDVNRGTIYDGPLMIMVNGYSASASEMLAGTLQDYNRAVIVGSPTYGKATAQVVLPLDTTVLTDDNFANKTVANYLKLTMSQLYRVSGNTAQFNGVIPDILLPEVLELIPQKEKDEPHALLPQKIEAAKYFKPLPVKNIATAKAQAQKEIAATIAFEKLDEYNKKIILLRQEKDINLELTTAMIIAQNEEAKMETDSQPVAIQKLYIAETNNFTRQREGINLALKELNNQWLDFLNTDPYIKIAYSALCTLIL